LLAPPAHPGIRIHIRSMAPFTQSSSTAATVRLGRRSRCTAAALLATSTLSLTNFAFCSLGGVTVLSRPRPRIGASMADLEEPFANRGSSVEERPRKDSTELPVQLDAGVPHIFDRDVAQGPHWATCFVEALEAGRVGDDGVLSARNVLEEWVVRGERENVNEFKNWRQSMGSGVSVHCQPKSAASVEDAFCLECVSHSQSAYLPFTPIGNVKVMATGSIMTFGGLDQCIAQTAGMGYCKTGSVAM